MMWYNIALCLVLFLFHVKLGNSIESHGMALEAIDTFPNSQLNALQKLYNTTNGPYWTWKTGKGIPWDFSSPNANPCTQQWQGVNCSRILIATDMYLDTVTSINLAANNMSGYLPNVFSSFGNLTSLKITTNHQLVGVFPTSLCTLPHLQAVNLSYNSLTGTLPSCMSQMISLERLHLSNNYFQGVIPNAVCGLTSLKILSLAYNHLTAFPTCPFPTSLLGLAVDYNRINTTIPSLLCNSTSLRYLGLGNNSMIGTIPTCLDRIQHLEVLHFSENALTGTIPSNLCNMHNLIDLYLDVNQLRGALPTCTLTANLTTLKLNNNSLVGSIPTSFTLLTNLKLFDASYNQLTGTYPTGFYAASLRLDHNRLHGALPSNLFSDPKSQVISLGSNSFTGEIPDVIPVNSQLYYVALDNLQLTGTIPSSMCNMLSLTQFTLSNNYLGGTLPQCTTPLRQMSLFDIAYNELQGSLSSWICSSNLPQIIFVSGNYLTGSLTPCLGTFHNNVTILEVDNNQFTGTVPLTSMTTRRLLYADMSYNHLEGSLSSALFGTHLITLYLQNNRITGTLPEITMLPSPLAMLPPNQMGLVQFNISSNQLRGTIPQSFYKLMYLKTLDVSLNMLQGQVNFTAWSGISQLFLQQNQFTGTISQFVPPSHGASLSILDISDNQFTGSIPDSIFSLPNLTTLVVGVNCFTGYIPATLCNGESKAKGLSAISFDGIATADNCVTKIFPGPLDAYTAHYQLFGSIPSCLFTDYPNLEKIHFSGNKLGGSLPSPAFISPSLYELVLSHNRITGTIPVVIQQHAWQKLDLSFNKFTGYLSDSLYSFAKANQTLKLSSNRLSGDIPNSIYHAANIDILSGNMFSCNDEEDSLPEHDPGVNSYQCGSTSTDSAVFTWLSVQVCVTVFILIVAYRIHHSTAAERQQNYLYFLFDMHSSWEVFNSKHASEFIGQNVGHIYNYGLLHHQLRYWTVSVTIMIWCIGLLCYPVLSQYMCMYYNAYIWAISAIYISGVPAAAALLTIFLIFLLFFFCQAFQAFPLNLTTILASYDQNSITKKKKQKKLDEAKAKALAELEGQAMTLDHVHEGNRQSTIQHHGHTTRDTEVHHEKPKEATVHDNVKLSSIWILLLLGNLVVVTTVNMGYVAYSHSNSATAASKSMLSFIVSIFKLVWSRVTMIVFENTLQTAANETNWVGFAIFMTWISLFNNIVAPMLAIAIYSKDCFFYAFFGAADITSDIRVLQTDVSIGEVQDVTALDPSIINLSVVPVTLYSNFSPSFAYSYGCTAALLSSFVSVFIFRFVLTGAVMPALQVAIKVIQEYSYQHYGSESKFTKMMMKVAQLLVPLHLQLLSTTNHAVFDENVQVFGIYDDFVSSITDVAIFLTFGTIFPPLAFIGCLGFIMRTVFNQLIMGQVVNRSRSQDNLKAFVKQLNKECQDIFLLWKRSIFTVAFLLSFTWGVLTFDTLGDDVGTKKGSWTIPFCMAITGVVQVYNIIQEKYFPNAFQFREIKNPFYFDEENVAFGKVMELSNLVQQQVQSNIINPLANVSVNNPLFDGNASNGLLRTFSHTSTKSKASFGGSPSESSPPKPDANEGNPDHEADEGSPINT